MLPKIGEKKDVKCPFVSRLANIIQGCFTFFLHPLVVNSYINEDIWSFLVDWNIFSMS